MWAAFILRFDWYSEIILTQPFLCWEATTVLSHHMKGRGREHSFAALLLSSGFQSQFFRPQVCWQRCKSLLFQSLLISGKQCFFRLGRFPCICSFLPFKQQQQQQNKTVFPPKLTIWLSLHFPPNRRGGSRMFASPALFLAEAQS